MRLGVIVSLGASTVLGLGALLVAKVWMPAHAAHAATAPPVMTGVPVVTAAKPIPYGARLDASYLKVIRMPAGAAPVGAFSSVSQILGGPNGPPVALAPMTVLEPILPADISGPGERLTLAALIADGHRAYTIGVTEVTGDGGHVMPGDRVDVVLTRELPQTNGPNNRRFVSGIIIQNLKVLGMDQNANPSSTQPSVSHTATLEVGVVDALKLATASQAGTLSLALRKPGATEIVDVKALLTAELGLEGPASVEHGPRRTPGPPRGPTPRPAAPSGPSVIIVQGDAKTSMPVSSEGATS
jgi:pilus assembly protein CpaB